MIKKIKNSLLILFIIFCFQKISAQDYSYKHYGVEDGLPSSEVYSAFQDSKGYMWFATDAGVSRFNGYEFENFDASDGLTDNTVFLITEDHKGRIWFGTFNLKLCYYENDSIYPYKYNDSLKEVMLENRVLKSFVVDSLDNVWMGFYNEGIVRCSSSGEVEQLVDVPANYNSIFRVFVIDEEICWGSEIKKFRGVNIINNLYNHKNEINIGGGVIKSFITKTSYGLLSSFSLSKDYMVSYKKGYLLTFFNDVYCFEHIEGELRARKVYASFYQNSDIFSVNSVDDFLFFCSEKGVYQCHLEQKKDSIIIDNLFLPNKLVSRIYKDKEGGLWFMTLKEGIYYLPNKEITYNNFNNKVLESIEIDTIRGKIYCGLSDGNVLVMKEYNKEYKNIFRIEYSPKVLKYNYEDSTLLISSGGNGDMLKYFRNNQLLSTNILAGQKSFLIQKDTIFAVDGFGVLAINDFKKVFYSMEESKEKIWCTSLLKIGKQLWIGTNEGVRIYKDKKITNPYKENKYLSSSITSMERLYEDVFLIGTKSYGLLVVQEDSIIDIIDKEVGLIGNLIRTIHVDNQKVIWAGTNTGLSKIDYKKGKKYEIYNLTIKHGLISGEITDICSYKNTIYVATPKGLVEFDKTKITANLTPAPVYITEFKVNTIKRKIKPDTELNYQENFININYEGLSYRSLGEVEYQYRMLGVDTNWTSTLTRTVQYPTLNSGNYTFEVKAKNEDGYWSKPAKISFTINPPFWLTWWFISSEIIVILIITFLVFKYREKQIRTKERAEKRMVELELKALRSQMNPHFIFNTLNSIQNYIALNDFKSSNKYITQFARLIRMVLNLSEKNMITIQEEIDVLKMYMDLERMRFDKQFDYEIKISDEIDSDYDKIPSMLLQPYVENAIWHGLMNKTEKGRIKIEIKLEEDYLCCTIEDNGIGRKKAVEISANRKIEHKSIGMSITKERLDLMSNAAVNVNIIDIVNSKGVEIGTKVIVKIPYKG